MARYGKEVDCFIRPRWAAWLNAVLERGGFRAGKERALDLSYLLADEENPNNAPRAAVAAWLAGTRTISPERAFQVGQALGEDPRIRPGVDGIIALHGAGYFAETMACLEALIKDGLASYPSRKNPALDHALMFATGLPIVHAAFDGLEDKVPVDNALAVLVVDSNLDLAEKAWAKCDYTLWADLFIWSRRVASNLNDSSAIAWCAFIDSISVRALRDERLGRHWAVSHRWFQLYRGAVFGGEPWPGFNSNQTIIAKEELK